MKFLGNDRNSLKSNMSVTASAALFSYFVHISAKKSAAFLFRIGKFTLRGNLEISHWRDNRGTLLDLLVSSPARVDKLPADGSWVRGVQRAELAPRSKQ